jgi:hypothetical protein
MLLINIIWFLLFVSICYKVITLKYTSNKMCPIWLPLFLYFSIINNLAMLTFIQYRDKPNYTEKFRGIYTVGWNYRRKRPNSVGKRPTVGIILRPRPQFFHNFVSFHLILMFLTILEPGDKTKNIEDELKTI